MPLHFARQNNADDDEGRPGAFPNSRPWFGCPRRLSLPCPGFGHPELDASSAAAHESASLHYTYLHIRLVHLPSALPLRGVCGLVENRRTRSGATRAAQLEDPKPNQSTLRSLSHFKHRCALTLLVTRWISPSLASTTRPPYILRHIKSTSTWLFFDTGCFDFTFLYSACPRLNHHGGPQERLPVPHLPSKRPPPQRIPVCIPGRISGGIQQPAAEGRQDQPARHQGGTWWHIAFCFSLFRTQLSNQRK